MAKNYLIPFVIFLIISVLFGIVIVWQSVKVSVEAEAELPMVDVKIYSWGYNLEDDTEALFSYWLSNYGDKEVKNVKVTCKLFDTNDNMQMTAEDNFGNIASQSTEFGEFTPKIPASINFNKEYSPICYVSSCDNCEILYKRIPDLVESYSD